MPNMIQITAIIIAAMSYIDCQTADVKVVTFRVTTKVISIPVTEMKFEAEL